MCGITGFFSTADSNQFIPAFRIANDAAQHRGPDGQGFALFNTRRNQESSWVQYGPLPDAQDLSPVNLMLGHRRLAIIDLTSAGTQPMSNEDGSIWITYNGEVYNYLELRVELERTGHVFHSHSDTEVIIHA